MKKIEGQYCKLCRYSRWVLDAAGDEIDYFCGNKLVCPFHTCASWAPKEEEPEENEDNYCRW